MDHHLLLMGNSRPRDKITNVSVTILKKLYRIKIFRQTPKGNKWNLYFVTARSCPISDFSLFILDLKLKLRSKNVSN